jgi:predicted peptidase
MRLAGERSPDCANGSTLKFQFRKPRLMFVVPLVVGAAYLGYLRWSRTTPYEAHTFTSEITGEERSYAVFLPKGYRWKAGPWPTILYLHGFGEAGNDPRELLDEGLGKELAEGLEIPFIVVAPQAMFTDHYREGWRRSEEDVVSALRDAQGEYRIDAERIYLTGNSMGGVGAFYIASKYPELFAAVAPIAGEGEGEWAEAYENLPFWVFHGRRDEIVPSEGSEAMVSAMREQNGVVDYTVYPEVKHDSWTQTYRNPELYAWFLRHRREGAGG